MLAHGAQIEWSPSEIKPKDGKPAAPGRPNPNIGKTPVMAVLKGGAGASIAAGPGFNRLVAPPFREPGSRDPLEALNMLLAAGANPNAKAPDGSTPLHLAAQEQQVPMIRALVAAGGKLDAVNKDNLTPLLLVEKPKKPDPADMGMDPDAYHPKRNSKEEVVAALRELMHLGPNDPAPQPPPLPPAADKDKKDDKEQKKSSDVATVTKSQ
jgi:ankyrin repeat protein